MKLGKEHESLEGRDMNEGNCDLYQDANPAFAGRD
jgi:hypothetical protein